MELNIYVTAIIGVLVFFVFSFMKPSKTDGKQLKIVERDGK